MLAAPATWATRVAVAGVAATAAGGVWGWQAFGGPTMSVTVGPGSPLQVVYGSGGQWVHAAGSTLGSLRVTAVGASRYAAGRPWFSVTGIPVADGAAVNATGMQAGTCVGAAARAFMRGWGW